MFLLFHFAADPMEQKECSEELTTLDFDTETGWSAGKRPEKRARLQLAGYNWLTGSALHGKG